MLTECQNCNFFLQKNDQFCWNCGYPPEGFIPEAVEEEKQGSLILIFSCLIAILVGGIYLYSKSFDFTETNSLIFYLLLGFLGGVVFFKFFSVITNRGAVKRDRKRLYEFLDNASTLNYKDETLSQKLIELDDDLRSVEDLERESDLSEPNKSDFVCARDFILAAIALCELQKERISFIRMENAMLPIIYRNGQLSNEEAESEINQLLDQLESIRLQISDDFSLELQQESSEEKETFLGEIAGDIEFFSKLRDQISLRQASAEENVQLYPFERASDDSVTEVGNFDFQSRLAYFNSSYKRIENILSIPNPYFTESNDEN